MFVDAHWLLWLRKDLELHSENRKFSYFDNKTDSNKNHKWNSNNSRTSFKMRKTVTKKLKIPQIFKTNFFLFQKTCIVLTSYMSVFHLTLTMLKTFETAEVSLSTKASKNKSVCLWKPLLRFWLKWNSLASRKRNMH